MIIVPLERQPQQLFGHGTSLPEFLYACMFITNDILTNPLAYLWHGRHYSSRNDFLCYLHC